MFKPCLKCHIVKPASEFGCAPSQIDGLNVYCLECCREKSRLHYKQNRERVLEASAAYSEQNAEKISARKARYYVEHREEVQQRVAAYKRSKRKQGATS